MSADWIETERTRMHPFEETDAGEAFTWFSDPEVMKYIPGGLDATLEGTRSRIARYREHQARFGFSKRLIIHRETGRAIGDSGLYHLPDGQRIELGFRLARPYWGAGYAVEVGRAWLGWFDEHLKGEPLFADVHPDNFRSQRVLSKLGFDCSHSELVFEMPMLIYCRYPSAQREALAKPPRRLSYEGVTLDFSKTVFGDATRGLVPYYHYRILVDGTDVGHINLRMGDTEHVRLCAGHVGFEIAAAYRGHRYAFQACLALAPFARSIRPEILLTCDPENSASRRTIELLGATYLDEVPVPSHDPHYIRGSRSKQRFLWLP